MSDSARIPPAGNGRHLSYDEAVELLLRYGEGSTWPKHCMAVCRLAVRMGELLSLRYEIDTSFLRTAALIHDIGRYKTHDPILHGVEGYLLLNRLGYQREAFVCASHVLFGLQRKEAVQYGLPGRDFIPTTLEERLIPVLDALVEFDRPTTIERRLSSIRKRYEGNAFFLRRVEDAALRTREFIACIDEEFGISMEMIARQTLS